MASDRLHKALDTIGTVLLFIGAVLAFLPHALHAKIGLDSETSHVKHVVTGIILIMLSLALLIWNNKALKIQKSL